MFPQPFDCENIFYYVAEMFAEYIFILKCF